MKHFPEESTRMIATIFWLFPMCTQLMKYAAGDIVPSLKILIKHGPESKFFVSISGKLKQVSNIQSRKVVNFENCEIYLTIISHTYGIIKPPCRATISVCLIEWFEQKSNWFVLISLYLQRKEWSLWYIAVSKILLNTDNKDIGR